MMKPDCLYRKLTLSMSCLFLCCCCYFFMDDKLEGELIRHLFDGSISPTAAQIPAEVTSSGFGIS